MSFEPGTVIAGKYRVERVIGQGGMGVVLAARHLGLDEMVAVKLIREERATGADALARFQREARAAARIKSEHVARVLDVDRLPEGAPYIVMELIDGTDLHALVKRRGSLPPEESVTYVLQACEGLAEAHALGMVHRDLKLKNLFLTTRRDGRALIKVIDFGVVKLAAVADDHETTRPMSQLSQTAARDATLTGVAMLVGSVHYMAPEQIRASNVVDARADVWSLGVCLYALLTGALPFDGDDVAAVCAAIQGRPAPDVRELAPHVPPEIAATIHRALEKDIGRRFANVAELAVALGPFGLDPAAPSRIETILQSTLRELDQVHTRANAAAAPPDLGPSTMTSDPQSLAKARAESTIDAAAVGSIAPVPAPSSKATKRGLWITTMLILLGAAAGTFAVWGRPKGTLRATMPAAISATTAPDATPSSTPSVVASAASTAPPQPTTSISARTPTKHLSRPPRPVPSSTTTSKSEPSSAYDHF